MMKLMMLMRVILLDHSFSHFMRVSNTITLTLDMPIPFGCVSLSDRKAIVQQQNFLWHVNRIHCYYYMRAYTLTNEYKKKNESGVLFIYKNHFIQSALRDARPLQMSSTHYPQTYTVLLSHNMQCSASNLTIKSTPIGTAGHSFNFTCANHVNVVRTRYFA